MHYIIAPDVRLSITFNTLGCDITGTDTHADAKVVGSRDREGGQTTHNNLIGTLLKGQGIFDIRPTTFCRGGGVGGVVNRPDSYTSIANTKVFECLPIASAIGITVARDIEITLIEQLTLGIIDVACCSSIRHSELCTAFAVW